MAKYFVEVRISNLDNKANRGSSSIARVVEIDYKNETYRQNENMIRDTLSEMANEWIDKEFYGP